MDKRIKNIQPIHLYIAAIVIALIAVIISFLRIGEVYSVLSEFGADTRTALVYNFLLFISGLLITIAAVRLSIEYFKKYKPLRSMLFIASSLSLGFLALFPYGISRNINGVHSIFTYIFFFGMPICMILFSIAFRKSNRNIGLLLISLGIIDILQLIILFSNKIKLPAQIIAIIISIIFVYVLSKFSSKMQEVEDEFSDIE